MDIVKGRQNTVSTKFSRLGAPATFVQPPKWTLYNSQDEEIISGAAVQSGNTWEAIFTVSNNYVVPNGKESLLLQFTGFDNRNNSYTRDYDVTLIDSQEGFKPVGIIYNLLSPGIVKDSVVLPETVSTLRLKIFNPLGVQQGDTVVIDNITPSSTSGGYTYVFNVPLLDIAKNEFLDPYQLFIEYETSFGSETEMHPIYLLDMKTINIVNTLRQYLDKGQLYEIDPSLQWHPTEYIQSVLEGIKYINASPPEVTFWNTSAFPSAMDKYAFYAAAFFALNMRYLAEGMQAFDFSGLNTTLNFNRTDPIMAKISEIQGILERLEASKKSAINVFGKGTPTDGTIDKRRANLGTLGLSINLLSNRRNGRGIRHRFM